MIVQLAGSELSLARYLAHERQEWNQAAGVRDQIIDDMENSLKNCVCGILGEWAYAKAMNLFPDLSCEPRHGGHDLTLAKQTIDVKASRLTRNLYVVYSKRLEPADIYVRVYIPDGKELEPEIVGYIFGEDLFKTRSRISPPNVAPGPGEKPDEEYINGRFHKEKPCFWVHANDLRPVFMIRR